MLQVDNLIEVSLLRRYVIEYVMVAVDQGKPVTSNEVL